MVSPLNITNIPAPRVDFIDPRTGLMSREWYRFFLNLFTLTGGGTNQISVEELQYGPPSYPGSETINIDQFDVNIQDYSSALVSDFANLAKQIQAAELSTEGAVNLLQAQIMNLATEIQAINSNPPQNTQLPWSGVINQPRIEAYDTSATIALTSTPTLLKPASTMSNSSGITYDASTGVFVFSAAGSYNLSLNVNATAVAANQFVYIYAEQDAGAGWVVNANSGKTYELTNANTVQIVYSQAVYRVPGQKVRYYIYSNDGKVRLDTVALPGGVGASVPAIRIQYS